MTKNNLEKRWGLNVVTMNRLELELETIQSDVEYCDRLIKSYQKSIKALQDQKKEKQDQIKALLEIKGIKTGGTQLNEK